MDEPIILSTGMAYLSNQTNSSSSGHETDGDYKAEIWILSSYRNSHLSAVVANRYDRFFEGRIDSLTWDGFVKPWLHETLEGVRKRGRESYLDFACGTGRVLKQGAKFFEKTTGIDISENMLALARQRVPEALLHCLDVTCQQSDHIGRFDCVSLFRFLRNAEPELAQDVLDWIWEHMNEGAILVVNNHGHSSSISGIIQKLAFWLPAEKRNLLSRKKMLRLLEQSGFTVLECRGFQVLPGVFGRPILGRWLQERVERALQWLGLGRFGYELVVVAQRCEGGRRMNVRN